MQPLEIVVTGDVSGAKSALTSLQGEMGKTAIASKNANTSILQLTARYKELQDIVNKAQDKSFVPVFAAQLAKVKAQIESLGGTVPDSFGKMSVAVNNTTKEMDHASQGAQRLHQAISRSTDPLQIAAREINNFSRRLLYMAGAGVMGLAIEGFQLIIPYVEDFFSGINRSSDAAKLAAENLSNMNDVMADANKKAGEQITDLQILYKAATDVNLSMKDRLAAVKALQKEFPDYFGNVKSETILNGEAGKSYDDLTRSILANSRAKAAKDKIDELNAKRLDQQYQKQKIIAVTDQQISAPKANQSLPNFGYTGSNQTALTITPAQQNLSIGIARNVALNAVNKAIGDIDNQIDFLKNYAGEANLAKSVEGTIKPDKIKKTNPFEISLKDLEDNYKQVQALRVQQYDANISDSKKNTTAINDILLSDEIDFLNKKLALIKQYGKKEGDTQLEIAKANLLKTTNQSNFTIQQNNTLPKIENAPQLGKTNAKLDTKAIFEYSDAIKANIKLQMQQQAIFEDMSNVLNKDLGPAFTTLFTGILEGSKNAFKGFTDAIKNMLIQLGAAILKAALFSVIISALGGGGFTSVFQKLTGLGSDKGGGGLGGLGGFASGGKISGPGTTTSDSMLARVSNGEYIVNANAVSKFGSSFFDGLNSGMLPKFNRGGVVGSNVVVASSNNIFIPDVTLKGQDLIVAFNRANQRASRNG